MPDWGVLATWVTTLASDTRELAEAAFCTENAEVRSLGEIAARQVLETVGVAPDEIADLAACGSALVLRTAAHLAMQANAHANANETNDVFARLATEAQHIDALLGEARVPLFAFVTHLAARQCEVNANANVTNSNLAECTEIASDGVSDASSETISEGMTDDAVDNDCDSSVASETPVDEAALEAPSVRTDDAATPSERAAAPRSSLLDEVRAWCSCYVSPSVSVDRKTIIKLRAFLVARFESLAANRG